MVLEEWEIMINNPDAGTYKLNLVDITGDAPELYASDWLRANSNSATVKNVLNKFYWDKHRCDVTVDTVYYDADGNL